MKYVCSIGFQNECRIVELKLKINQMFIEQKMGIETGVLCFFFSQYN